MSDAPMPVIVMGRCPGCRGAVRLELPAGGIRWASAEHAVHVAGLEVPACACRAAVRCPEMPNGLPECLDWDCSGHAATAMKFRYVKVTFAPGVECRGACATAKSSICTCSCAGRNHGIAWAAAG